jgi:predicted nucleotidyltransferase
MLPDLALSTWEETLIKNSKVFIAYIFGSLTKGKSIKDSDLVLAIYTTKDFSWKDYYDYVIYLEKHRRASRDGL